MSTFESHECPNPSEPLGLGSSEQLGASSHARGCDSCAKRGPWQTETTRSKPVRTYELAECHHMPKPAWWRNAGPLWVAHGCGNGCKVWAPLEAPNARLSRQGGADDA